MFRHEMSPFLKAVLDTVATLGHGVPVDDRGQPDPETVALIARRVHARDAEIRAALEGLRATHCLVEERLELDDIESVGWWTVHPQCASGAASGDAAEAGF